MSPDEAEEMDSEKTTAKPETEKDLIKWMMEENLLLGITGDLFVIGEDTEDITILIKTKFPTVVVPRWVFKNNL
jgi:hypothetical protein